MLVHLIAGAAVAGATGPRLFDRLAGLVGSILTRLETRA